MLPEPVNSFFSNLSSRTRNPFLGTFTIVWLSRNWELVFAIFNFDDTYTLEMKIAFLSDRVKQDTFWSELGVNILWTFGVLIGTYTLINLARIITNLFEKHLTPLIYKWTADSQSIVLKTDYDLLKQRVFELEKRVEQEREEKLKARTEIENLEFKIQELLTTQSQSMSDIVQKKVTDNQESRNLEEIESKLVKKYGREEIFKLLDDIKNEVWMAENQITKDLKKMEYIYDSQNPRGDRFKYGLSSLGNELWKKLYS